jgi:D-alanyl-D-alanine carboxypeptidase
MKQSYTKTFPFIFVIFIALFSSCKSDSASEPTGDNEIVTELNRVCDSIMTNSSLPGMVVGVWSKEKGISYVKGLGYSNLAPLEKMNPDYHFRIGSNTKSFVITTILQLVDEGKLLLEDKLSKYFPNFPDGDKVTLRMMCNMSSGINNYTETEEFAEQFMTNPLRKWMPQELVDLINNDVYHFEPGTDILYSNTNTVLLGMIIEQITGKSLEENITTRFIDKYELTKTIFPTGHLMPDKYIHGYANITDSLSFTDDVSETFDLSWGWAAGAIISDIYNTKKWVEMLIDGNMISDSLQQRRFTGKSLGVGITYGLAIFTRGFNMWGHNGGLPGYTSVMMHHRTLDLTIVVFCNWQNPEVSPDNVFKRLVNVVYPEM